MILTHLRHIIAACASWLAVTVLGALGIDVGPEAVAELTAAFTGLGNLLLLILYAVFEKSLKRSFLKMGERQLTGYRG